MIVIVGAGQGGYQVAASLREGGYDGRVLLIGDERHAPYQRPPLSKTLGEDGQLERVALRPPQFYEKNRIELMLGDEVASIDRRERRLALRSGGTIPYERLVLALGAANRVLPLPGGGLDGVYALRTLDEALLFKERLTGIGRLVIVGAGFIGLEVAACVAKLGIPVLVVELAERAMGRSVTPQIASAFVRRHEANGIRFAFGRSVSAIRGEGRVVGVTLSNGTGEPADAVLIGAGAVPNTALAEACGLAVDNGIVVDDDLRTSDEAIFALGDCARFAGGPAGATLRLESVQNAIDQGKHIADVLLGKAKPYVAVPWFWSDQGSHKLQIAGLTSYRDQAVARGDPRGATFSMFCFRDGAFLGAECFNSPSDFVVAKRLLQTSTPLTATQASDPAFDLKRHALAAGRG